MGRTLTYSFGKFTRKGRGTYNSGCRRLDSAIKGYGGCPMAKDELVGNMPTEKLLFYSRKENKKAFESAYNKAIDTFNKLSLNV